MAYSAHGFVFFDCYWRGACVTHVTTKRHKKTLSSHLGRKGNMPSVVPPTFHAAHAIICASRASLLADNGCPPRQPAASKGGSVSG
jgi:hypothetical protein